MTAAQLPETAVVRVAHGNFDPARFDEVQAMTVATGRYLRPAIKQLPGLISGGYQWRILSHTNPAIASTKCTAQIARMSPVTGMYLTSTQKISVLIDSVRTIRAYIDLDPGYDRGMDITADAAGATGPQEIPGDPLALERQVCFALSIAARSVLSVYRPLLEPMGLTHPQYLVMLALWGKSPLAVKELIEMLQLDGPTLSPLLKRLEAAGLVTRTRDPHDERQLRVDLTPRGHALRQDALRIPPSVVAKLGMSLGDLEELRNGLTAINEAARRAGVNPLPAPAKDSV